MGHKALGLTLVGVTMMLVLVASPLPVHAAATLVQQTTGGCSPACSVVGAIFGSSVTSGNVVVVGVYMNDVTTVPTRVYDTLGSGPGGSYTQVAFSEDGTESVTIFIATLTTSGADTVNVNPSGSPLETNVYAYEVSGVMTTVAGSGHDAGSSASVDAGSVSFQAGAFLLGIIGQNAGGTVTHGSGFTLSPNTNTIGTRSAAQYSDPVSSPSTFPATLSGGSTWAEAAVAINPAPTPPIPEYPFGLTVLAIFIVIGYGLVRRRTRN